MPKRKTPQTAIEHDRSIKRVFLDAAHYRTLAQDKGPLSALMALLNDLNMPNQNLHFEPLSQRDDEVKEGEGDKQKPMLRVTVHELGLLRERGEGKEMIHANVVGVGPADTPMQAVADLLSNCLEPDRLLEPLFGEGKTSLTVGVAPNKRHREQHRTPLSTKPRPHTIVKFDKPPSIRPPK